MVRTFSTHQAAIWHRVATVWFLQQSCSLLSTFFLASGKKNTLLDENSLRLNAGNSDKRILHHFASFIQHPINGNNPYQNLPLKKIPSIENLKYNFTDKQAERRSELYIHYTADSNAGNGI